MRKPVLEYNTVFQEETDGGFSVWVPDLPGCASQGETFEEALRNIKEAIEVYLESMLKHQSKLPLETRSFQGVVQIPVPLSV